MCAVKTFGTEYGRKSYMAPSRDYDNTMGTETEFSAQQRKRFPMSEMKKGYKKTEYNQMENEWVPPETNFPMPKHLKTPFLPAVTRSLPKWRQFPNMPIPIQYPPPGIYPPESTEMPALTFSSFAYNGYCAGEITRIDIFGTYCIVGLSYDFPLEEDVDGYVNDDLWAYPIWTKSYCLDLSPTGPTSSKKLNKHCQSIYVMTPVGYTDSIAVYVSHLVEWAPGKYSSATSHFYIRKETDCPCLTETIRYVSLSVPLSSSNDLFINNQRMGIKYDFAALPDSPHTSTISSAERGYIKYETRTTNRPVWRVTIANGGAGYIVNDVLEIGAPPETYPATVTVDEVDGSGAVTAVSGVLAGYGYNKTTYATTGGSGAGCTITVSQLYTKQAVLVAPETNTNCLKVDKVLLLKAGEACHEAEFTYYGDFAEDVVAGQLGPAEIVGGCSAAGGLCSASMYYRYLSTFNCWGETVATPGANGGSECLYSSSLPCGVDTLIGDCDSGLCKTSETNCTVEMTANPCATRDDRTLEMKAAACCPYQLM